MECQAARPAPLRCPTFEETLSSTALLAPRGVAWPVNDGGGTLARYLAWLGGLGATVPKAADWPDGFVQAGWFAALAASVNYLERRLCDLRLEFWCATQSETRDLWLKEYGLPDACDPFPDLCAKVAALGGANCEYYADLAARAGWAIYCIDINDACGAECGCALAGDDVTGGGPAFGQLFIDVDLAASAAYTADDEDGPYAGALQAGSSLACDPDIGALICILERVVHADIEVIYRTI